MSEYVIAICGLVALFCMAVACKYELQMMQQNSYRIGRYWRWLCGKLASSPSPLSFVRYIFIFVAFFAGNVVVAVVATAILVIYAVAELSHKYKKKLIFTSRAIRLYITALVLGVAAATAVSLTVSVEASFATAVILTVFAPLLLTVANIINMPVDKAIGRWYYRDAEKMLAACPDLIIVGITGSYGKTSTKHYLHRILSEKYNVLMTPGSFNTTLGVIRTIREYLKPYHNIFIVEMGAKQAGDIAEICRLVNPRIGIITAVGEQHLESFKTIERVQQTKFELIDALPKDGFAVLNDDFEYVASRAVTNVKDVVRYSSGDAKADYGITDVSYTSTGTNFCITHKGVKSEPFATRLVGSYNLSNLLASYITARHLGVEEASIRYAMGQIEQVEHRLNVKRTPGGVTIIDDAFNSNPYGAKMALEVLGAFKGGRRIVVTPGFIELGSKQHDYNMKLGAQAASACDYVIVVGQYNREAIVAGLKEESFPEPQTILAATLSEAVTELNKILKPGDVVLYENDLPDTFK